MGQSKQNHRALQLLHLKSQDMRWSADQFLKHGGIPREMKCAREHEWTPQRVPQHTAPKCPGSTACSLYYYFISLDCENTPARTHRCVLLFSDSVLNFYLSASTSKSISSRCSRHVPQTSHFIAHFTHFALSTHPCVSLSGFQQCRGIHT